MSQTIGGLRIANPDDDAVAASSSPVQSSAVNSQPSTPIVPEQQSERFNPSATAGAQGLNIEALGFDPSAYTAPSNPAPSDPSNAQTSPVGANAEYSRFNNGRALLTSLRPQDGGQQPSVQQPVPRNVNRPAAAPRPTSGIYNHAMTSSPGSLPESRYQRLRAESTQASSNASQSGVVRRTMSKGAAAAAMGMRGPQNAGGGVYRQSSQSHRSHQAQQSRDNLSYGHPSQLAPRNDSYSAAAPAAQAQDAQNKGSSTNPPVRTGRIIKKGVKDFSFGRTLGEGSYSTVLAGTDRQTSREYAIKVLDKKHIIKEKKVKYVNIEKDTLNRLTDHPGVVKLYYTFQDERSLYFVLDLAANGELLGHLKKHGSFDEDCTRFYSAQMLDAIEYMHERGIIHRDLKPENVLLDDQMHVKITDFGTAKILDLTGKKQFGAISVANDPLDGADTDRANSFVGTAEYVSPELLTDKNACKASDLWAFGCIIFQLLAGRPPFKAGNEYLTFQKIVKLDYSFPDSFPSTARDLVKKLLVLDPSQRPNIDTIKAHPFFEGIQWGKGLWKQKAPKLKPLYALALAANAASAAMNREPAQPARPPVAPPRTSSYQKLAPSTSQPPRPQQRVITELAPPTQLDIDWSPVLTKANERIVKLGQFVINSSQTPHSPTSRSGADSADAPSKFSRFFGASSSKKRQRLVLVTSGGRLILVPGGGEKKEVKVSIELADNDVSWRSQLDPKGYTIWIVSTVSPTHLP